MSCVARITATELHSGKIHRTTNKQSWVTIACRDCIKITGLESVRVSLYLHLFWRSLKHYCLILICNSMVYHFSFDPTTKGMCHGCRLGATSWGEKKAILLSEIFIKHFHLKKATNSTVRTKWFRSVTSVSLCFLTVTTRLKLFCCQSGHF